MKPRLRVLELFSGIGGCAAALGSEADIVCAVDIGQTAMDIYRANFAHPTRIAAIESLPVSQWRQWNADLWWMSPPCQPYSVRGLGRDLDDPRAVSLVAVVDRLREVQPRCLAMENVPGFSGSRAHALITRTLRELGYDLREYLLCPTQFGIPNRRRRFYLAASRGAPLADLAQRELPRRRLAEFLDDNVSADFTVPPGLLEQYRSAVHIVDADDPHAETHCFTSAYGRSPVRSGSYLRKGPAVRRFTPEEILRFLGFPDGSRLPDQSPDRLWPLVGNSLSVVSVRAVLSTLPGLRHLSNQSASA
jgi:site-specific DNA-cytosine methylase